MGSVADIVFSIPIELYENPKSKIEIKYFGLAVDGFLGPEQMTNIKPKLIADVIKHSIAGGWRSDMKGNYRLEIYENSGERHRPAILILPGFNEGSQDYANLVKLIKIF